MLSKINIPLRADTVSFFVIGKGEKPFCLAAVYNAKNIAKT
jgi:hypothetical protein